MVVVFDPPYAHHGDTMRFEPLYRNSITTAKLRHREIMDLYRLGMAEAKRVIKPGGTLWVKCADEVENCRQKRSHVEVFQVAQDLGLEDEDLFILMLDGAPVTNKRKQWHDRKNCSGHRHYDRLAIQEGGTASQEFLRVHFTNVPDAESQRVCRALEEYCGQDTQHYRRDGRSTRLAGQNQDWMLSAGFERRAFQRGLALNKHQAPLLGSGDRVIQQSALVLGITAHCVWPDDDDPIKFPVLGLVNSHGRKAAFARMREVSAHREQSIDVLFHFAPVELHLTAQAALTVSPFSDRSTGESAVQVPQARK